MSETTGRPPDSKPPSNPAKRRGTRRIVAIPLFLLTLWLGGLVWYAEDIPRHVADATSASDAVIVLTGGSTRLDAGFDLLLQGRAQKLFISGVAREVNAEELIRLHGPGRGEDLRCCVVVGHAASDTTGNAREAAEWMAREQFTSLRLVTASYHMRRSLLEFRYAMPQVAMIPHPVFPQGFRGGDWWRWPGTLHLVISEYSKFLAALASQALGIREALTPLGEILRPQQTPKAPGATSQQPSPPSQPAR
jgi:uncharacterized SAM-binding protein YcdF (DUF218 family)